MGSEAKPEDFVFVNRDGQPISGTNLETRNFKDLLKTAGLPDMRFHDLRHSHATLLLTKGKNAKVVQERLGHESVKATLDLYAHVLPTSQRECADLIGTLFGPTSMKPSMKRTGTKRARPAKPGTARVSVSTERKTA